MKDSIKYLLLLIFTLVSQSESNLFSNSLNSTFLERVNLSPDCASALLKFISSIPKETWALKMLDASGKIPSGILSGNINNIGDRTACVNVQGPDVRGRYIRAILGISKEAKTSSGLSRVYSRAFCLPDICSQEDFTFLIQGLRPGSVDVQIIEDDFKERKIVFDAVDIIFMVIISIMGIFVLVGTLVELLDKIYPMKKDVELLKIFKMFSLITNTKEFLAIPPPESPDKVGKRLDSLDGIRFISITWVLICHTLESYVTKLNNGSDAMDMIFGNFWSQTISNAFSSVDTFFVLSGILVSYLTSKELERNSGRLNWFLFYFHRYVRLTIVYGILILFVSSLYRHIGPSSDIILQESQKCRDVFWTNLLYIGNLINQSSFCVGPSWYLDCDMQMFIISPLIVYPLWKKQWTGIFLGCSLIAGSTGIIAWKHYEHRDIWGSTIIGSDRDIYFSENYVAPWMRIQPYLVGLIVGNVLFKLQCRINLSKWTILIGWALGFAIGFTTIYGLDISKYMKSDSFISQPIAERIAYGSLSRLSWGLAVGWVIFACETGYGGIIHEFLSWEFFKPLSKLTFLIYLIHMNVIRVLRDRIDYSERFDVTTITCGILLVLSLSILVSYFIHILLEVPFGKLEKYLISRLIKK
ncbi:nose resistant to fluoxetine protein 6 [Lepeophtheirus salmonis]|uniref:nose resistant to fluoxetine protein 6 n=1 Tax=Lepeophtheirus salmonis TaxID=72036 RepID=UPI001AE6651E|nr:nose resistant to fluoxetine protein 6-like [Lepeophtheirus salmonis]